MPTDQASPDPRGSRIDYALEEAAKVRNAMQQNISSRQELESVIDQALKRAYKKVRRPIHLDEADKKD